MMKKILLLLLASFAGLSAMAQLESVCIQLQVNCRDLGSEVHYKYNDEPMQILPLKPGNNFYQIEKGSFLEVMLFLEGGGYLHVTGLRTQYVAAPTTNGFILCDRNCEETIIIRLDEYPEWEYPEP